MTEREWQSQVLELARLYRWRFFHARPAMMRSGKWATAMMGDAGFPDLVLVRGNRLVIAELKTDRRGSRTTPQQDEWLAALRKVPGVEVYEWRPSDWPEVRRVLE